MSQPTSQHTAKEATLPNGLPLNLELETLLATAWGEVLGQDSVDSDDNFFDLGGNSLTVVELRQRLAAVGIQLAMPDIFRYPSVRTLSSYLAAA